jgi:hypothetical protein
MSSFGDAGLRPDGDRGHQELALQAGDAERRARSSSARRSRSRSSRRRRQRIALHRDTCSTLALLTVRG